MTQVLTICATVLATAVVGAVTALAFDNLITGSDALTYFSGITIAGVSIFGVSHGATVATNKTP